MLQNYILNRVREFALADIHCIFESTQIKLTLTNKTNIFPCTGNKDIYTYI